MIFEIKWYFRISRSRNQHLEISKLSIWNLEITFRYLEINISKSRINISRSRINISRSQNFKISKSLFRDLEINIRDLEIIISSRNQWINWGNRKCQKINKVNFVLKSKNNNIQIWNKRQKGTKVFAYPKWLPNFYFYFGGFIS